MSDVAATFHTHSCGTRNEAWRVVVWSAAALALVVSVGGAARRECVAFAVVLGAAAAIDATEFRLPNELVATAAAVAMLSAVRTHALSDALLGAFLAGVPLLLVHLLRGVGMGDVKAAAVVGLQLGQRQWWAPWVAVAMACVTAAVIGWWWHRQRLAFGPFLWCAWAAVAAWLVSTGRSA